MQEVVLALIFVKQETGFYRTAATQFDQRGARRLSHNIRGMRAQNLRFGPGEIVFRLLADILKQPRTAGIIKILGRQGFLALPQAKGNIRS